MFNFILYLNLNFKAQNFKFSQLEAEYKNLDVKNNMFIFQYGYFNAIKIGTKFHVIEQGSIYF
jgi:hypothetical protein